MTLKRILNFYILGSCIPHFESRVAVPYFVELMKEPEFEVLIHKNVIAALYDGLKHVKTTKLYAGDWYFINDSFQPLCLSYVQIIDCF